MRRVKQNKIPIKLNNQTRSNGTTNNSHRVNCCINRENPANAKFVWCAKILPSISKTIHSNLEYTQSKVTFDLRSILSHKFICMNIFCFWKMAFNLNKTLFWIAFFIISPSSRVCGSVVFRFHWDYVYVCKCFWRNSCRKKIQPNCHMTIKRAPIH